MHKICWSTCILGAPVCFLFHLPLLNSNLRPTLVAFPLSKRAVEQHCLWDEMRGARRMQRPRPLSSGKHSAHC